MTTASPKPKPRPAAPAGRAPVHYAPSGPRPACLPGDRPPASRLRKSTAVPGLVNCRHCRDTAAWQDADLFAGLDAYRARRAP